MAKVKHLAAESEIEKSDPRSIENLPTVLTNGTFHNLCTTMYNNHHQITFHNLCTITISAIATCRTRMVTIKMKTTRQLEVDLNLALVQAMPLYLTHCVSHTVTNP